MSDTPRTDAAKFIAKDTLYHPGEPMSVVTEHFSCELERENAQLRALLRLTLEVADNCARPQRNRLAIDSGDLHGEIRAALGEK